MSTRILLTALVSLSVLSRALAQAENPPAQPAEAQPAAQPAEAVQVEGAEPGAGSVSRSQDTLSVDFPDEDIKTILRNVADLFELNLVVPDTLAGKTSIKLRDVTWRQIFQVVLSPVGYSYVEEGNIIKIVSNEQLNLEPGTTEVFLINNAKADALKPTLDAMVDAATGGKIVVDGRSNALIITERPSRMVKIRKIIEALDKATDQVMLESKFIEVTDRDVRNIGINWASLQGIQLGAGGFTQTFNRTRGQTFGDGVNGSDSLSNTGSLSNSTASGATNTTTGGTTASNNNNNTINYSVVPNTVNASDGAFGSATLNLPSGNVTGLPATVPSSVAVSNYRPAVTTTTGSGATAVTNTTPASGTTPVVNTTTTANGSNSSTSNTSNGSSSLANTLSSTASSALSSLLNIANTGSTGRAANAVFTASNFNVVLSALKSLNNTKIVSNPTVVTLNNSEAFLNIGQEFPIPNYTYNAERGTFEVAGFTYKPIGIIMKVTPQVNSQGVIKMTLEPEVSQRAGETSFGGAGGASIPIIATRKVKTTISLQNGHTLGIGGLLTSNRNHGGNKVPILGEIPGLGRLFSNKTVNDEITNLLIFITARTVSADGASPEEIFDPRMIQATNMAREDLPGNRAPKGTDIFVKESTEQTKR
jgi:type II secretory pathway component GspD/PulD (secretin)